MVLWNLLDLRNRLSYLFCTLCMLFLNSVMSHIMVSCLLRNCGLFSYVFFPFSFCWSLYIFIHFPYNANIISKINSSMHNT